MRLPAPRRLLWEQGMWGPRRAWPLGGRGGRGLSMVCAPFPLLTFCQECFLAARTASCCQHTHTHSSSLQHCCPCHHTVAHLPSLPAGATLPACGGARKWALPVQPVLPAGATLPACGEARKWVLPVLLFVRPAGATLFARGGARKWVLPIPMGGRARAHDGESACPGPCLAGGRWEQAETEATTWEGEHTSTGWAQPVCKAGRGPADHAEKGQ